MQISDEMVDTAAKALFDRKEAQKTNANLRWVWEEFADASDTKTFWRGEARTALSAALSGMAEPVAYTSRDFLERLRDNPCEMFYIGSQGTFRPENEVPLYATPPASDLREENERLRKALKRLLDRDERNTCQHEDTHRGGFIWEICEDCGAKWADDEGGKPEWQDPPEWVEARAALAEGK